MKRYIRSNEIDTEQEALQEDADFDDRWDTKFGEPTTEVFTPEEFESWMQEVIRFE